MPAPQNLRGQRFGRLTAIQADHYVLSSGRRVVAWHCVCSCGNKTLIHAVHLVAGRSKSCGCLNAELGKQRMTTHGKTNTTEHRIWKAMIRRCYNPKVFAFKYYGGRGIFVCDRWRTGDDNYGGFECFLSDMGPRPEGMTLDRHPNNNGNYEPSNCRWATRHQQANNKRSSLTATLDGETKTVAEWADFFGISRYTIYHRIHRSGLSPEVVLRTISLR